MAKILLENNHLLPSDRIDHEKDSTHVKCKKLMEVFLEQAMLLAYSLLVPLLLRIWAAAIIL